MSRRETYMGPKYPYDAEADLDAEGEFSIASQEAYVASATITCAACRAETEVICIHCASGTASGEPLRQFTVSDVSAIDEPLARQLQAWPTYRMVEDEFLPPESHPDSARGYYANHCSYCGAVLDDMYLHSEPDEPFFDIPGAAPGSIKLTPLSGPIRLSGDEHFELD